MACRNFSQLPLASRFDVAFCPAQATVDTSTGFEPKTFGNITGSPKPRVIVRPKALHFGVGDGVIRPMFRRVWITSKAVGMKFSASQHTTKGGNWLVVAPASGVINTASFLAASVISGVATSLDPGVYDGVIEVQTPGAAQETHEVHVTLKVFAPGEKGSLLVEPAEVVFNASQGGPNSPSQVITMEVQGQASLPWTGTISTQSGGSWLTASPPSGSTTTQVTVSANSKGLTAGSYTGSVIFSLSGDDDGAKTVLQAKLIVSPPSQPSQRSLSPVNGPTAKTQ